MTASLFYEQKYDWSMQPISELFEIHRPKEVKRARRFISDVLKLPHYKQDELYEFLFHTACMVQEKMKKDKELTEWLEKLYLRWMRYNGLERDERWLYIRFCSRLPKNMLDLRRRHEGYVDIVK